MLRQLSALIILTILIVATALLTGCGLEGFGHQAAKDRDGYVTVAKDPGRDSATAAKHNAEASRLLELGRHDDAEKELKAALDADLFCGPAHNNLGAVYLQKQDYYHAAWEFQYAAKLMPGKAEPLYNLAMVYEAVGQLDSSRDWYTKAHELEPEDINITCGLARVRVRTSLNDQTTQDLLRRIVLQGPTDQWRQWARRQLLRITSPKQIVIPIDPNEDI